VREKKEGKTSVRKDERKKGREKLRRKAIREESRQRMKEGKKGNVCKKEKSFGDIIAPPPVYLC